jgi:Xaa-Pro aminopeptidase
MHAARRACVLDALGPRAALVLPASPELRVGRDGEIRYVPDADLFYLTGCTEPGALLVLRPGADDGEFTMLVRGRDPAAELWQGPRGGVESARERFGADAAFDSAELAQRLPALLHNVDTLLVRLGASAELDALLPRLLREGRARQLRAGTGVVRLHEPGLVLDELRLVKDADEIAALRAAAEVTVAGFRAAFRAVAPEAGEWQVEAALECGFRERGASGPAFPSIVAGGVNATVLHYTANAAPLDAAALLLIDAGARVRMYCGDVSRTVPVSGRFSADQRRIYEVVLRAHGAAIAAVRPGATVADVHEAARLELAAGLRAEGVLPDGPEKEATDALSRYYPHRTSHWLGLDVHDVGGYMPGRKPRVLEPGMVLTVEPGLYFPPDADVPGWLHGTGVRIEDAVLVTPEGHDVLTGVLPVTIDDLEALLR